MTTPDHTIPVSGAETSVVVSQSDRYRHVKRGTVYEVIGTAELQAEQLQGDHAALTIYRGEDGKLWARNTAEFQDGRFTRLTSTPQAASADVREAWPGRNLDLAKARVTVLGKLGLMLTVMAGGQAAEVDGYDAADLYSEVLMALAIEDAEDPDIALEIARDHPEGDTLVDALAAVPAHAPSAGEVADGMRNKLQQTWDLMSSLPPLIFSESEADHLITTILIAAATTGNADAESGS